MAQSRSALLSPDAEVDALWQEAIEEFQKRTESLDEFNGTDTTKWAEIIRTKHRRNDQLDHVCRVVGRHMDGIKAAVDMICSVCGTVAAFCPAASPATILMQGFGKLFSVFATVQKRYDDLIEFFSDMDGIFKNVSVLAASLERDGKLAILRENVLVIFSCALKILAVAISSGRSRLGKALKDLWRGTGELDGLKFDMDAAKRRLDQGVVYATYDMVHNDHMRNDRFERNEILEWLSNWDYMTRHEELLKDVEHSPRAGTWLLESKTFQDWKETPSSRLWYEGKPGVGKSVLASIIIREMERIIPNYTSHGPTLAFMHFTYKSNPKPKVEDLLGAVVRQIVTRISSRTIPGEVMRAFKETTCKGTWNRAYRQADRKTIQGLLFKLIQGRTLYAVVDAMDECPFDVRKPFIQELSQIGVDVRILVTGRRLEGRDELTRGFEVKQLSPNASDMDQYIDYAINSSIVLQEGPREEIKKVVKAKGGQMFLLVKLHMNALCDIERTDEIRVALSKLPDGLNESYSNAIERINDKPSAKRNQAITIVSWMSYTFRDLRSDEMCAAIVCQTGLPFDENTITSVCCGLVVIESDNYVRFVHYSARDFFRRRRETNFQKATTWENFHLEIAHCSVRYLCNNAPSHRDCRSARAYALNDSISDDETVDYSGYFDPSISKVVRSLPFAKYAAEYLHQHLQEVPVTANTGSIKVPLLALVEDPRKRNFYFYLLRKVGCYPIKSKFLDLETYPLQSYQNPITPLHLTVFLGHAELVDHYIKVGSDVNALDCYGQSPILIAFKRKRLRIVEMLLDRGASVNLSTRTGHVLLLYTAQHGFDNATEKILKNVPDTDMGSSLADMGLFFLLPFIFLKAVLKVISESFGSSQEQFGRTAEVCTSAKEQKDILLHYEKLLSFAYRGNSWRVESFLQSEGITDILDTSQYSGSYERSYESHDTGKLRPEDFLRTACFLAIEGGHTEILKIFLERGIDPNLRNYENQPVLHRAAYRDNIDAVNQLLDRGAEIENEDDNKRTALTAHAQKQHMTVVKVLQNRGANISHLSECNVHELYKAAVFGNSEMVQFFLEAGVNPSVTNEFGWTPLHGAAANGHKECVRLLMDHHVNPSLLSDTGFTPLDLVHAAETHYDWRFLGEDSEHYLGSPYKEKPEGQEECDRREDIRMMLAEYGAKTGDRLYDHSYAHEDEEEEELGKNDGEEG